MPWRRTRNIRADPNVLHGLQQYNVLDLCVCVYNCHKRTNFHVQGNILYNMKKKGISIVVNRAVMLT